MKVNLKTTNDENAAATPNCHQRGQRTVNGIIGNTRRGIVIDKTLDPNSNNPVANKPVSTALAALAGQLAKGQVVFLDQLPESGEPHKIYVLTATNQRYWWDGSAFVKIVPTDIKDSATIKHTLAENKISLDLDEAVKGKIDAALQKPTGLTKTKLVGVGSSGQENIEIGDNLTLKDGKLAAAGKANVSPTLNLLDMSTETPTVRTSITEEEKQNIEKGLYNQVIYTPNPSTLSGSISARLPSKILTLGNNRFLTYFVADGNGNVLGAASYPFTIGSKDPTTEKYPITINEDDGSAFAFDVPVEVIEGEVKWITSDSRQHKTIVMKDSPDASLDKFILHYVDSTSTYTILFNRIQQITNPKKVSSFFGTDGSFYYSCTSADTSIEEIQIPAIDETILFDKWKVLVKHIDDITPQPILPYTTADNGKVLSVVNGQAQWANTGGGVTVTFED